MLLFAIGIFEFGFFKCEDAIIRISALINSKDFREKPIEAALQQHQQKLAVMTSIQITF